MMLTLMSIALGGVMGALLRYGTVLGVHRVAGRGFPYGTLVVNVTGSLLVGLLAVILIERFDIHPALRAGVFTGFLGAFTTFSAFSFETLSLIETGAPWKATGNMLANVGLCLAATWLGLYLGRRL